MWSLPGAFSGEHVVAAGMATSGAITRWFADHLVGDAAVDRAYDQLFREASAVPAGANGLLLLPYFSGERTPINDPAARGVVAGLSLATTRADVFRAVLEGVAFGLRDNLEVLEAEAGSVRRIVAVGGGTANDTWPSIVSDVIGRAQSIPSITVGAAYGDALLAGIASGHLGAKSGASWASIARTIAPNEPNAEMYDTVFPLYRALYQSTRDTVHALASLQADASNDGGESRLKQEGDARC
jgi:xylulokinase